MVEQNLLTWLIMYYYKKVFDMVFVHIIFSSDVVDTFLAIKLISPKYISVLVFPQNTMIIKSFLPIK